MRKHRYYFCVALFLSFSTGIFTRPVDEVITAMISVIPAKRADLKKELEDILVFYHGQVSLIHEFDPPEAIAGLENKCFYDVQVILSERFKDPNNLNDWQSKLIGIFTGKLDYKQYVTKEPEAHKNTCCGCF